jgi:uncharacterized membrane protein YhaH (DUF805 family)
MLMPLRRYADFEGRSRRMEYWMWVLFNALIYTLLIIPLVFLFISAAQRVEDRGGVYQSSSSYDRSYDDDRYDRDSSYEDSGSYDEDRSSRRSRDRDGYGYSASYSIDMEMMVEEFSPIGWVLIGLYALWALIAFIPSLAVGIRRLHDTNKSGWLILLGAVPIVGGIILLVFMFSDGTRGPNQFGPDPKERLPNQPYA